MQNSKHTVGNSFIDFAKTFYQTDPINSPDLVEYDLAFLALEIDGNSRGVIPSFGRHGRNNDCADMVVHLIG
ncbi:MAG: hypothetical protein WD823_11050 [Sulfuricaulis sp.]